ncbi:uncharacterized protein [Halyomorpha halys]|uniref:uncharacterized protein n=1 Tax=Halyomorpha halys TaxID=286706 RepID=UPI0006D4D5A3|nr:uncharacterized protein LOC106682318 [Halyomorpha halys]
MVQCCYCQITKRIFARFWDFWIQAADRLSSVILASVFIGSLGSAIFFNFETRKLEEQLSQVSECHEQAETENLRLRKRTLALWNERSRVSNQVARIEAANARTDAQVKRLKHKDSLGRAEMAALCGDLKQLRKSLAGAYKERNIYRNKLDCFLSQAHSCKLRPVTN